ncbi:MAG TPA: PIG-L family deacetylase [Chloroflexi bacterium]|nr:PIG-L family deacetylase [Chloroflexota bacterium]
MVAMAHPDDAEFGCAGSIAKWVSEGQEVILVLGTSGDKGSDDLEMTSEMLVATREAEQRAACAVLGISEVVFLRMRDAELVPDLDMRRTLTRVIRQHKPDAIICQDPTARWEGSGYVQHPDHIAMGEATLAALFPSARDRLTFPELLAEGLAPHKVTEVYINASREKCDHFINFAGEHLETKIAALTEHRSQMGDWDFRPALIRWARDGAADARAKSYPGAEEFEFAEGFKYLKLD